MSSGELYADGVFDMGIAPRGDWLLLVLESVGVGGAGAEGGGLAGRMRSLPREASAPPIRITVKSLSQCIHTN